MTEPQEGQRGGPGGGGGGLAAGILEAAAEVPPAQQGGRHQHVCLIPVQSCSEDPGLQTPASGSRIPAGYHLSPEGPAVTPTPSKQHGRAAASLRNGGRGPLGVARRHTGATGPSPTPSSLSTPAPRETHKGHGGLQTPPNRTCISVLTLQAIHPAKPPRAGAPRKVAGERDEGGISALKQPPQLPPPRRRPVVPRAHTHARTRGRCPMEGRWAQAPPCDTGRPWGAAPATHLKVGPMGTEPQLPTLGDFHFSQTRELFLRRTNTFQSSKSK